MSDKTFNREALLVVDSDPESLRLEVERFVAAGGTGAELVAALNSDFGSQAWRVPELLCYPKADVLMDQIADLSACRLPLVATAAACGAFDALRGFMAKGADPFLPFVNCGALAATAGWSLKAGDGRPTPQMQSAVDTLGFLLESIQPSDLRRERDRAQALVSSVRSANPEMVRILLDAGADANHLDDRGMTPLLWLLTDFGKERSASAHECPVMRVAKALLEAGADPNGRGAKFFSPLHALAVVGWRGATQRRVDALIQLLVDHGADLDAADPQGITPIAAAVLQCHDGSVSSGSDSNALFRAHERARIDAICVALLKAGASTDGRLPSGLRVVDLLPAGAARVDNARRMAQGLDVAMGGGALESFNHQHQIAGFRSGIAII